MKFTHEEILNAIVISKILEQRLQSDSFLGELIGNAGNSNIYYGTEFIPTIYQRKIFERRVKTRLMKDADEMYIVNADAFQKVLEFIDKKPESPIFTVVFNCISESFTVWCGVMDGRIEVLCALVGGHIPDYAFEKGIE